MSSKISWEAYGFVALVLILQVMVYFVVYANVPIARMVVSFLFLMFVPGLAILKLLEMKNLDTAEKFLFSTGLSIAFLMFIGLIINEVGRLAFTDPLSLNLLLIGINMVILLISLIATRHGGLNLPRLPQLKRSEWLFSILLIISLFVLGSYGTFMVNTSGNSSLILLLIIAISIAFSLVILSEKIFPPKLYPLILFVIFICAFVFVGGAFITKYIGGAGDGPLEYYVFRLTGNFWNSQIPNGIAYYSMISITILPAVFSNITAMDSSFLFHLLYALLASFLAIGAYKLYQTQTDNKTAFLATFFLITVSVGKGMGPYKQQIAELFYVLLFLVLLRKNIAPSKRAILLIFFGAALVISHYSLTYIFLFIMLASFLILLLLNYIKTGRIHTFQAKIPLIFLLTLCTITFSWYIFVNGSTAFGVFLNMIDTVTRSLNQFFNPASRGTALQGLGVVQAPSIFNRLSSFLFIFTEILLVVGFFVLMRSKGRNSKYSTEYKIFAFLNLVIIALNLLLPNLADTFIMSRFYQVTLILLAPLMVLGGKALFEFLLRGRFGKFYTAFLACIILVPLFLFQTNFIYEIAQEQSWNVALSMYRWNAQELHEYITNAQEVIGTQWISQHTNLSSTVVYSDYPSVAGVLNAYGLITNTEILSGVTIPQAKSLTYLPNVNLLNDNNFLNSSLIPSMLENQNKIYSNGQCEIYSNINP